MESSVVSISFLQKSIFFTSAFCWSFSSASILSMTSFTLVKGSRRTRTASVARTQLLCLRAALRIFFIASATAWLRAASLPFCTLAPCCAPTLPAWRRLSVLPKRSRASSPVRMLMASPSAFSSWPRASARIAYCSSLSLQVLLSWTMKAWSAVRASCVVSRSSSAWAFFSMVSASVASFWSLEAVAAWISAIFEERSFWNATMAPASCFWSALRFLSNSSFISESMPYMEPLWEL
mmetsp:Transcript_24918/g.74174  ORF Transcript_24918/g.74174 Transcript_24918/m.74174 type:complete len:236 (-) Transcript_24918:530-1237(-)